MNSETVTIQKKNLQSCQNKTTDLQVELFFKKNILCVFHLSTHFTISPDDKMQQLLAVTIYIKTMSLWNMKLQENT